MLRSLFVGGLLLLFSASSLMACSCDGPGTFCQTVSPSLNSDNLSIFTGFSLGERIVDAGGFNQPVVDILVTRNLRGTEIMAGDTITLIGQDGVNCGLQLSLISGTLEQVFTTSIGFAPAGHPGFIYPYQEILFCGVTVLSIEHGNVYGPIAPGIDSLSFVDFSTSEEYCVVGAAPEGCFCTAQVVPFCDEVSRYDQSGIDFGIVRLTKLNDILPAYDTAGGYVELTSAIITEVLLGEEFLAGDTVAVAQRDGRDCVEWNFSTDALWAYTDVDYDGVVYTSRFNDFPRLLAGGCDQNTAEIVNNTVSTLPESLPYEAYLEVLAECVPALSAANLGDAIGLSVFPNPVDDRLTVSWEQARVQQLDLLDVSGRTIVRRSVGANQTTARLELSEVPPGVYFLRLAVEGGVATRKVVVR